MLRPRRGIESRVIRFGADTVGLQTGGEMLGAHATLAINDSTLALVPINKAKQLLVCTLLGAHPISQVGAIKARHITTRPAQTKLFDDVGLYAPGSRSSQRHQWRLPKQIAQLRQLPVLRTKVMTHSLMQWASSIAMRFTGHSLRLA